MAPNGNGAVYEALVVNGCLKQMYYNFLVPNPYITCILMSRQSEQILTWSHRVRCNRV